MSDSSSFFKYAWAKTSDKPGYWLPLYVHLSDTAGVAGKLWSEWMSGSAKHVIETSMAGDFKDAKAAAVFVAAAHDIGKCTPAFQSSNIEGKKTMEAFFRRGLDECGMPYRLDLSSPN